jgi:hypothetical protein
MMSLLVVINLLPRTSRAAGIVRGGERHDEPVTHVPADRLVAAGLRVR